MAGYKRLFDISLNHSFFNQNECSRLSFVPTTHTKSFLHKADLIFHCSESRMSVSYNTGFTGSLVAYKADDIDLIFKIKSSDPFFYNYTDLEHGHGKTLYFDSSLAHPDGENHCLSLADKVTSDDERDISDEIFRDILTRADRIIIPFGVISIGLTNLLPDGIILDHDFNNHYVIKFGARQTYWRYNVIQRNDKVFDDIIIKDSRQEIAFSGNGRTKLSNGSIANQIISNQPISLHEFSNHHFDLIGIKDNQETLLVNRLDVPDIKMINKDNDMKISELYIYC